MYLTRTLEKIIKNVSKSFPVLIVTGPRQVGKTTLLEACSSDERTYVSLDDLRMRDFAQKDPALFLEQYKAPLFIDEIQYAPDLLPYIKYRVDRKKEAGMYWITGTQRFNVMKNVTESLAGRIAVLQLQGLSQAECDGQPDRMPFLPTKDIIESRAKICRITDVMPLYHKIWKGSFPGVYTSDDSMWETFYNSYLQTYIERDVRQMKNIANEMDFVNFLKIMAFRSGQILNYSDIARDANISHTTVKQWMSILSASGLIFYLGPYYKNVSKRMIRSPKVYFYDTGLVCYLLGIDAPKFLKNIYLAGHILETYVVSELAKSWIHNGKRSNMYFYRDKDKREIKVIIEKNGGTVYPVEITMSSNPGKEDIKSFDLIESVLGKKRGPGAVLCLSQYHLPITADVYAVPIEYI